MEFKKSVKQESRGFSHERFKAVHFPGEFGEWIMWKLIIWIAIVLLISGAICILSINIIKTWKLLQREKSIDSKEKKLK